MKIIFDHDLDWCWQIYDEWARNHEVILPDSRKKRSNINVDLDSLEKCVKENKDYDFIFGFWGDLYDLIQLRQRKINIPVISYAINAINRPNVAKRSIFSIMWYSEKYAKALMEKYNKENLIYKGMGANQYIFYPLNINKIYDIGFFGQHYGERGYWLKNIKYFAVKKKLHYYFPAGHGVELPWSYEDINKFYNQTKINLSFAPKEPQGRIVNLRTFEICMSGNFQLMQYTPCVEEYFEIDEEIVCWKNEKELFEKISYFLENEAEREKIARKGYKRAIENHTWTHRLESIISFLNEKKAINLKSYIVNGEKLFDINKFKSIQEFQKSNLNSSNLRIIQSIMKRFGYSKINKILKLKGKIKIKLKDKTFFYKLNLKNFYFIEIYGKTMMVIKSLSHNNEINNADWENLKKIIYLTENLDHTIPQFGLLTNIHNWLIFDFKNRIWLKTIPTMKFLKANLNLKVYQLLRLMEPFKKDYKKYYLNKLIPKMIKKNLKQLYIRIFRKMVKL